VVSSTVAEESSAVTYNAAEESSAVISLQKDRVP